MTIKSYQYCTNLAMALSLKIWMQRNQKVVDELNNNKTYIIIHGIVTYKY